MEINQIRILNSNVNKNLNFYIDIFFSQKINSHDFIKKNFKITKNFENK